jgi:hypothetical protein
VIAHWSHFPRASRVPTPRYQHFTKNVRFEFFTTVTMKNGVFWDVMPCGSVRTNDSEELSASFIRVFVFLRSVRRLLVTTSVVPSSPILVTLMKEALSSSETSVLTRATQRNIQEDAILHFTKIFPAVSEPEYRHEPIHYAFNSFSLCLTEKRRAAPVGS